MNKNWIVSCRENQVMYSYKHKGSETGEGVYLLRGEDSGVASLPTQTSSILERTLLMKVALVRTLSAAERLATVDNGCGRDTEKTKPLNERCKASTWLNILLRCDCTVLTVCQKQIYTATDHFVHTFQKQKTTTKKKNYPNMTETSPKDKLSTK